MTMPAACRRTDFAALPGQVACATRVVTAFPPALHVIPAGYLGFVLAVVRILAAFAQAVLARPLLALLIVIAGCGDNLPRSAVDPDGGVDAPLAPCGIEQPGTRCKNSTTLERCNGKEVVTEDCSVAGALCGPDPSAPGGAACLKDGDACGAIDFRGACEGSVLAYCSSGLNRLEVVDCATLYAVCDLESPEQGYFCLTPCERYGITATGACDGNTTILRCGFADGSFHIETISCGPGTLCSMHPETNWPACLPAAGGCATVGPEGRCRGDVLTRCVSGALEDTDCAASSRVCAYGGPGTGYVCADSGATGAHVVSGTVTYEDRPPGPDGLGAPSSAPARGVAVAVVADDTGEVLAFAQAADDGTYRLHYDAPAGSRVHVLAATTSATRERPVRVIRPDGAVHGLGSASFTAGSVSMVDLHVDDRSGLSPAFNAFDQLVAGMDWIRAVLGITAPVPLFAQWVRGSSDGTYYLGAPRGIFLLGEPADDDGYDDAVILHELGHYVEDAYTRDDSPGGTHDGTPTDPRLAWSEGFATWFSAAVRGSRYYMDSNAGGGWAFDLEDSVTRADSALGMTQAISEQMVAEILYDMSDGAAGDDDPVTSANAPKILNVCREWLTMSLTPRGLAGVDLVDWLDGWFVIEGLGLCGEVKDIVTTTRSFPYDYAGPGGACPP